MKIDKLLAYLKCPFCDRGELVSKNRQSLVCIGCKEVFELVDGIPVLMKNSRLGEQEKGQIEWFNKHYSQFSKTRYKLENWRLSMLKRVLETDFNQKVKTYLDIGCGATGYTVIQAAKRFGWLSLGVDISLEAMLKAKSLAQKQKVAGKTAFLVCSAESLPFKPQLFDYVSALSLLEHLKNDTKVIASTAQILKGDGHFYICTPNAYKRMWPFLWPIYLYLDKIIGHQRHYSIEGLNQKMKKSGFRLKKVFYNGHLVKLLQLGLEKLKLISDKVWWRLEKKDINQNPMGVQLNAIYQKVEK